MGLVLPSIVFTLERPSEAIKGSTRDRTSLNQRSSETLAGGNRGQSTTIRSHQEQAPAITCNQRPSHSTWTAATKAGSGIARRMSLLNTMVVNEHSMYAAAVERTLEAWRMFSEMQPPALSSLRLSIQLWMKKRRRAMPAKRMGSQYSWIK